MRVGVFERLLIVGLRKGFGASSWKILKTFHVLGCILSLVYTHQISHKNSVFYGLFTIVFFWNCTRVIPWNILRIFHAFWSILSDGAFFFVFEIISEWLLREPRTPCLCSDHRLAASQWCTVYRSCHFDSVPTWLNTTISTVLQCVQLQADIAGMCDTDISPLSPFHKE